MVTRFLLILSASVLLSGCFVFRPAVVEEEPELEYPGPDSEIAQLLDSHRGSLNRLMNVKIATVTDTLRFEKPESALGNIVSDALRNRAGNELGAYVHVAVIDESSFRLFLEPGDLTLGGVYEFIPFENQLVILTLSGETLQEMIQQVAEIGGAPISGVRFRIDEENRARGILVNSEVIDPSKKYRVATSSRAANGGNDFPALRKAESRIDLDLSVRNVYVDYFRGREIADIRDGRIRN